MRSSHVPSVKSRSSLLYCPRLHLINRIIRPQAQNPNASMTSSSATQLPIETGHGSAMLTKRSQQIDTELAPGSSRETYPWLRAWWPVLSTEMLHMDRPNAVKLLAQDLVVWWCRVEGKWVVQRDSCPHRLSPLSLGHLDPSGSALTCSYHGWAFTSTGSCQARL